MLGLNLLVTGDCQHAGELHGLVDLPEGAALEADALKQPHRLFIGDIPGRDVRLQVLDIWGRSLQPLAVTALELGIGAAVLPAPGKAVVDFFVTTMATPHL